MALGGSLFQHLSLLSRLPRSHCRSWQPLVPLALGRFFLSDLWQQRATGISTFGSGKLYLQVERIRATDVWLQSASTLLQAFGKLWHHGNSAFLSSASAISGKVYIVGGDAAATPLSADASIPLQVFGSRWHTGNCAVLSFTISHC